MNDDQQWTAWDQHPLGTEPTPTAAGSEGTTPWQSGLPTANAPQPAQPDGQASGKKELSGYSAMSAVVSVLGLGIPVLGSLAAIVLGVRGIRQVGNSGGALRGRWMAFFGIGFGLLGIVVGVMNIGQWIEGGPETGDCVILDIPAPGAVGELGRPDVVDCAASHSAEIVGQPTIADGPYPGDDQAFAQALDLCIGSFAAYTGESFDERLDLDLVVEYPQADGFERGELDVTCFAVSVDGAPLMGSVAGP